MRSSILRFSSVIAIVCIMSFGVVYASPPASPYNLGETLSPGCAPGDVNCTVTPPQTHHNYLDDISAVTGVAGDTLYFDGTNWINLAGGAVGQALVIGAGGLPEWGSAASPSLWQEVANIISPTNTSDYRVQITNNSDSTLTGFKAVNTNDTHNYAGAVFEAKGSGPDYTNNLYYGKYSDNYYVSSWAGNGVMATDQDLILTSAGSTDATNPNPTPRILFQLGGGYTAPNDFMDLTPAGLAFTSGARINQFLDEDNFASDSDTALATQQSIKAYVDGAVIASGTTASNGLTKTGNDIQLGGTLTGNTTISGPTHDLSISNVNKFEATHGVLGASDTYYLGADGTGSGFGVFSSGMQNSGVRITPLEMRIVDQNNSKGLIYANDYSANYTNRSLVDKAYVDNSLSTTVNLYNSNGTLTGNRSITKNGHTLSSYDDGAVDLRAGDAGNTVDTQLYLGNSVELSARRMSDNNRKTINISPTSMTIGDYIDNKGIEYIADYSANYTNRSLVDKAYVDGRACTSIWDANNDTGVQTEESPNEDMLRFDTAGTERMRVDNNGLLSYGTEVTSYNVAAFGTVNSRNIVKQENSDMAGYAVSTWGDNTSPARFIGVKARGSEGSETTLQNGDEIMELGSVAHDGTRYLSTGGLIVATDGAVNTNDVPTKLDFLTNTGGGNLGSDVKMTLDHSGNLGLGVPAPTYKLDVSGTGRFTQPVTIGAYTLPNTDGASGQVLQTNGSGNLSWANSAGSSNGAPASADCDSDSERGKLSVDYTNNRLYVCNGAARGWDYISLTD